MFDVIARTERMTEQLGAELKSRGIKGFGKAKCRDLVARFYGSTSFRALTVNAGEEPLLVDEGLVSSEETKLLRHYQVDVLQKAGLPDPVAQEIIDTLRPLSRADASSPEFFIRPGQGVRDACRSVAAKMAMRRTLYDTLATPLPEDDSEKSEAMWSLIEPAEFEDMIDEPDRYNIVACASYLDRHGWTMKDFEPYFTIGLLMAFSTEPPEEAEWVDDATCAEMCEFICELSPGRSLGYGDIAGDVEMDVEAFQAFQTLLSSLGIFDSVWASAAESAEEGREMIAHYFEALQDMEMAGVTFAEFAAFCASLADADPSCLEFEYEDTIWSEAFSTTMAAPRSIAIPDRKKCDALAKKSLATILETGAPHLFLEQFYFFSERSFMDTSIEWDSNGRKQLSDLLVAVHLAGYGIGDLIASALQLAKEAVPSAPLSRKRRGEWKKALAGIPQEEPTDRRLPELAIAAFALDILPAFDAVPKYYVDGIAELRQLQKAGVTLADIVAFGLARLAVRDDYPPLWKPRKIKDGPTRPIERLH